MPSYRRFRSPFAFPFFGSSPPPGHRTYLRQEVYELVWTRPLRNVAKELRVSDVALKKTCRRLDIPTPPQGFWLRNAERRASVVRPALPEVPKNPWSEFVAAVPLEPPIEPSNEAIVRAQSADADALVPVAANLEAPCRLVVQTSRYLAKADVVDGVVSSIGRGVLDISVAPSSVDRALRIADALLKTLDARGLQVEVIPPSEKQHWRGYMLPVPSQTGVRVDGELIEFSLSEAIRTEPAPTPVAPSKRELRLRELSRSPRVSTPRRVRVPTGTLVLAMSSTKGVIHWRDRKRRRLETFLPEFVAQLYLVADLLKQKRAREEAARERELEEQRRADEEARLAEEKKQKIERLHRQLENWRLVRDLRDFASSIRAVVQVGGMQAKQYGGVYEYLEFILAYADEVDPLRALRDKVADGDRRRHP